MPVKARRSNTQGDANALHHFGNHADKAEFAAVDP
jgi:hypothetical protein